MYLPEDLSSYTNRLLLMGLVRDLDAEGALVDLLFADFGMSETIMTEIQEHKKVGHRLVTYYTALTCGTLPAACEI